MRRRRLLAALPLWAAASLPGHTAAPMPTAPADTRVLPPAQRRYPSPSGQWVLTIRSPDHWRSPQAQATLARQTRSVWQQPLPQHTGPRDALVGDDGTVLLLDDGRNSPSPQALMLLAPSGQTLALYSFDALVAALDVPRKTVAQHAHTGTWLSRPPVPGPGGLHLHAAGRTLLLNLQSGQLTLLK